MGDMRAAMIGTLDLFKAYPRFARKNSHPPSARRKTHPPLRAGGRVAAAARTHCRPLQAWTGAATSAAPKEDGPASGQRAAPLDPRRPAELFAFAL
jgi:hypothetical protein